MTAPGGKFLAKLKGENPDVPDASAMLSKQQQRQPPGATRGTDADTAGMIGAESELAPKLEKIASKGLDKAEEILDLPLDPDNPGTFGPTLRAQTTVLGHALTTQVRVDEGKMRVQQPDVLGRLTAIIREEEAKLPRRLFIDGDENGQ